MEIIALTIVGILSIVNIVMTVVFINSSNKKVQNNLEKIERQFREEFYKNREEMNNNLKRFSDIVSLRMADVTMLTETKLEKIRETVDEKLHSTLEKRLGESFQLVSQRLEMVYRSLGEMQSLADGVGELKKVLSNVKTRGTMGEIQLENILEQILTPDQYGKNVQIKKNSGERVEFAIKLPGKNEKDWVWLPLDAKFPLEDYQRLLEAYEKSGTADVEEAAKQLENTVKSFAKTIRDKYLDPPNSTDFGIMFLPVEGLYAEILRRPGLFETIQREYKVILTGPTTLAALLNSLQMGFRTLAIEKRSGEVWSLLGAVKTEFGRFGDILAKTQKKLQEASNQIDLASRKSRTIERKLKSVQEVHKTQVEDDITDTLQ